MNTNIDTKGMVIPKSYKNITEKKFGMTYTWLIVASITAIISGFIGMLILLSSGFIRLFFISVLIASWAFFWKKLRNDDLLEHSRLSLEYFLRQRHGETAISKYNDAAIPILHEFLPIEAIHKNGLIQYTNNLYFLLIRYIPVRLSDDMKEVFLANTVSIINSLQDGVTFKFFVVSRNKYDDSFEKQILTAANKRNVSSSTKEHLFSLQKTVSAHSENNIQWDFYMSFGIGQYSTPEDAEISRQSLLTGLKDMLETTETSIQVLESPYEITYALYNCIQQEV